MLLTDFRQMVIRTAFCAGTDGDESYNGVFLEKSRGTLAMTATDNRRVAFARAEVGDDVPDFGRIMVTTNVLRKIAKLKRTNSVMSIAVSDSEACFGVGPRLFTSKLLPGKLGAFPKNQHEFPGLFPLSFGVKSTDFMEALRMVSSVINAGRSGYPVFVSLSENAMLLRVDEDGDSAEIELPCVYSGDETELVVNARYITEIVEHIGAENVNVRFCETGITVAVLPDPARDYFFLFARMRHPSESVRLP